MLKVAYYRTADQRMLYYIYYYETPKGIRIDITLHGGSYTSISSEDYEASLISDSETRYLGNLDLINIVQKIMTQAATYPIPDRTEVSYDGGISMKRSKETEDGSYYWSESTFNGKLTSQEYHTPDGTIEFFNFDYNNNAPLHNLNYQEYVPVITLAQHNVKDLPTEGYYSYDELRKRYPETCHVIDDPENDYKIITSYEEAVAELKHWKDSPELFKGIDVESLHTEWYPGSDNRITGVILGLGETTGYYYPFMQEKFEYNLPYEFLNEIALAINEQGPDVNTIGHNVKFEMEAFFHHTKIRIKIKIDTHPLSILVNPDKYVSHALKPLTEKYTGKKFLELSDIFTGPIKFNVLPAQIVRWYACPDVTNPVKIYKGLMRDLPRDEVQLFERVETKLPKVKALQEYYGIHIDQERMSEYLPKLISDTEMLSNTFKEMTSTQGNINSYDVMSRVLYNKMKITPTVFTTSGLPATSKVAIKVALQEGYKLGLENPNEYEFSDIVDHEGNVLVKAEEMRKNKYYPLLVYQQYKLYNKQVMDLQRIQKDCHDEFMHFYVNQSGTETSRQTSNAQQFSDSMKKCVVPDDKHHLFASCDYSQVELRALAGLAGETSLIQLATVPGNDLHRSVKSIIMGKPIWMISEEERKAAKSVNFGTVYMMSGYGMAANEKGAGYTKEDVAYYDGLITEFFNAMPHIKMFIEQNKETILQTGKIRTAWGYYRYLNKILDPDTDSSTKKKLLRAGNNLPVQGFCATVFKMAELNLYDEFEKRGWLEEKNYDGRMLPKARLILPIHDEELISFDREIPIEEMCVVLKECMEMQIEGIPPLFASPAIVPNWYAGKDSAYEIETEFRDEVIEKWKEGIKTFDGDNGYLDILNAQRTKEILSYLAPLVKKYKTPEEVAKHVRHDKLTHTIIELIPKKERAKLTHEERILAGVKKLMSDEKNLQFYKEIEEEYKDENWDSRTETYDQYGNLITTGEEIDEDEEYDEYINSMESPKIDIKNKILCYTLTDLFVDISDFDLETMQKIQDYFSQNAEEDGAYEVVYVNKRAILRSGVLVNYKPKMEEELCRLTS